MKYPYIGKCEENELTVIFSDNGSGTTIDEGKSDVAINGKFECGFNEREFKNITTEYLANTYGEVKSKEHAEFIKLLADVNQFRLNGSTFDFEVFDGVWFCFDEDELYFYDNSEDASDMDEKQITIPLPPELNTNTPEEDFEMKQVAKNNDTQPSQVTFNTPKNLNLAFTTSGTISTSGARQLDITVIDNDVYNHNDLVQDTERLRKTMEILNKPEMAAKMERVNKAASDSLNENGDNLIFGNADKCKEWPCVNDEVLTSDGKGVVKLLPDSKGYYVVSVNGEYYQYQIDELSKPKTPEEELRDEISDLAFNQFNDDSYDLMHNSYYLAEQFISKYNITKKPQ